MSARQAREVSANAGLILGMLAAHPQSGYDLKQHAERTLRPFWVINYAQIYPTLRALRRGGAIEVVGTAGARRRSTYRLTRRGRADLVRWMRGPVDRSVELRDEMLLKLYFAALAAPAEVGHLAVTADRRERATLDQIAANRRHLADVEEPGDQWDKALVVLRIVDAMHRAYVASLRPLVPGAARARATRNPR